MVPTALKRIQRPAREFADVSVSGLNVVLTGLPDGAAVDAYDLLGNRVATARPAEGMCELCMPYAGVYMVRFGRQVRKVSVK